MTPELLWKLSNAPPPHNYIVLMLADQFSLPDRFPQYSHECDEGEGAKIPAECPIALILTVYDVLHFSTVERSATG